MIHLIQVLQISWFHARRSRRIENLCARRENLIVLRPISIVLSLSINSLSEICSFNLLAIGNKSCNLLPIAFTVLHSLEYK